MKQLFIYKIFPILLLCFAINGCTEQYILQTNNFENALVVEATITNELKKQTIKISRTFRLEENGPIFESGADVSITDNEGNQYQFEEEDSIYVSTTEFKAIQGRKYKLNFTTRDGSSYNSTSENLTAVNEIENMTATVQTREGQIGVQINVNSYDPNRTSKYYRYEYEETYKIITPLWDPDTAILLPPLEIGGHKEIGLIPRTGESKTCYSTDYSKDIILTTTNELSEDRVNFPVRFISNKNYIISHRYSILVRQYIQSLEAYTFYKTLKELSGSESILSQNQPGFFYGNINALNNPNEKIIGFFEVSSVSSKRIFFNYENLFPNEPIPPYKEECEIRNWVFCFESANPDCKGAILLSNIETNQLLYLDNYLYTNGINQVYKMVPPPCGDCTTFSSNKIPSFWIN